MPQSKSPELWVKILIGVNVLFYLISMVMPVGGKAAGLLEVFSPSNLSLVLLGATGQELLFTHHRFFTLVNAGFLHANPIHILFNMAALWQLFRPVAWSYGTDRALLIYLVTGVFAFLCSCVAGIQLTVGASASICGLMGALLYYAKSRGDHFGNALFREIGMWAIIMVVFGFTVPGVNNAAHLAGLLGGAGFGFLLGFRTRETKRLVLLTNICAIVTVLCLLYGLVTTTLVVIWLSGGK